MSGSEYLVVVILAIFVVFGVGSFIAAPVISRRFYRQYGFTSQGASVFDSPEESTLLPPLATSNLYEGEYQNYRVEHCKAHSKNRRKFTLNKVTRRHNQAKWSLTLLHSSESLPPFCLLPLSEPATIFIMQNDLGVDLTDDKAIANRYHLRTDQPEALKRLVCGTIREYLLVPTLISIECVDDTLVIKRAWPVEKIEQSLLEEVNCVVEIAKSLSERSSYDLDSSADSR